VVSNLSLVGKVHLGLIWMQKNNVVHGMSPPDVIQLVHHARKLHGEHLMAWKSVPRKKPIIEKWSPPPKQYLKTIFDVAMVRPFLWELLLVGIHLEIFFMLGQKSSSQEIHLWEWLELSYLPSNKWQ
jgi:hypothetical protein